MFSGIVTECGYLHSCVKTMAEESSFMGEVFFLETSNMEYAVRERNMILSKLMII